MRDADAGQVRSVAIGAVVLALALIGVALAFTRELPWDDGYEVNAVFTTSQGIREDSPVRIAGVEVGKVVDVDHYAADGAAAGTAEGTAPDQSQGRDAAVVTMRIDDVGRPIKQDATMELRPRLFLEGNLFVDMQPGSPSAPEAEDGHTFPVSQTSVSVRLFDVLGVLQSDVRADLQVFLEEFGAALDDHGGAEGLQRSYRSSPGAYRFTSQVNEALLGQRPRDLSGLIRHLDRVAVALVRNEEQLKGLVTNLRIVSGSFAAEDAALSEAVAELPRVLEAARPAFANLNRSFPPLRAFSREALPGVRSLEPTVVEATPFVRQLRRLASRRELRGLTADLQPTVPPLARLARSSTDFLEQGRALASCFNNVIIPWSNDRVDGGPGYPHAAFGRVYEETGYGLVGVAGESRSGDANGQYIRLNFGGGTNTVAFQPANAAEPFFGVTPFPLLGGMPGLASSRKTPFRPDQPCENQDPPDLRGQLGPAPEPASARSASPTAAPGPIGEMVDELRTLIEDVQEEGEADGESRGPLQRRFERRYRRFLREDFPRFQRRISAMGGGG
jgi:phospholipid/cholesterol/gamma-HCH transport system substrate-binding protein